MYLKVTKQFKIFSVISVEKFGSTLGLKLCVPADEESQRNFNNFLVSLSNDEEVFKNGAFHNGSLNIFGWKLLLMPLEERNEIRLGKEREKEHGRCGRPKAWDGLNGREEQNFNTKFLNPLQNQFESLFAYLLCAILLFIWIKFINCLYEKLIFESWWESERNSLRQGVKRWNILSSVMNCLRPGSTSRTVRLLSPSTTFVLRSLPGHDDSFKKVSVTFFFLLFSLHSIPPTSFIMENV